MNQFRLDLDATRCAQAHQDAHCGKMLLELVQQLCTAFPTSPKQQRLLPDERLNLDLLPEAALDWVVRHRAEAQVPDGPLQPFALAMPEEYQHQSGHMDALVQRIGDTLITQDIRHIPPHVAAYRVYYRAEKRGYWRKSRDPAKPSTWVPAKWTKRDPPEWF